MNVQWMYGVTTVPSRFDDLLPQTLASLEKAGFPNPRLFIDGCLESQIPSHLQSYPITCRRDQVRTAGNWILTAWELFIREGNAVRYAIFQDDFVTYRNLRQYLEKCQLPDNGYWNLYTFPHNEGTEGWHYSDQRGKGAVALVFSNKALQALLSTKHLVKRTPDPRRGHKAIDGGIVEAMLEAGCKEWVHTPSLVQHIGLMSSMGNRRHAQATSFKGEDFDAIELLTCKQ